MDFRLTFLIIVSFLTLENAFHFHNVAQLSIKRRHNSQIYAAETLAEKLGGIVEFISGQSKITESNIESTLKVYIQFLNKKHLFIHHFNISFVAL